MNIVKWCFSPSKPEERNFKAAIIMGLILGVVTIFVKWGAGHPIPPFLVGHQAPPVVIAHWLGLKDPMYTFLGHSLPWGMLVHGGTGISFGLFYCIFAEFFPRLRVWRGIAYGIGIAVVFHAIVVPGMGLQTFPLHDVNSVLSILSEIFSTGFTFWVCEEMNRSIRKSMGTPLPNFIDPNTSLEK